VGTLAACIATPVSSLTLTAAALCAAGARGVPVAQEPALEVHWRTGGACFCVVWGQLQLLQAPGMPGTGRPEMGPVGGRRGQGRGAGTYGQQGRGTGAVVGRSNAVRMAAMMDGFRAIKEVAAAGNYPQYCSMLLRLGSDGHSMVSATRGSHTRIQLHRHISPCCQYFEPNSASGS
jgi:hypothetical protein